MRSQTPTSRRTFLAAGSAAALAAALPGCASLAQTAAAPIATRPIPRSGERLPIVGVGTAIVFDFVNDSEKTAARREVIETLLAGGGKLIDTAPAYGRAEDRVGDLLVDLDARERLFLATKYAISLDRAGATASMRASLRRLRTSRVDLMQAWNVGDANYDFGLPRDWQRQGLCRYVGMTTSFLRQYEAFGKVLAREKPDVVQLNYSLGDREAENVLLPAAADAGAAVLVNLPFGRNSLFKKAAGRSLPDFAAEFSAKTWAQFFLKYILSHPAVTSVIPGTDKPEYMLDNLQAGRGRLPDAALRRRMVEYWNSLP